jgi:hypothetical protein
VKHRKYLKNLEENKNKEKEDRDYENLNNEEKKKAFKENAAKQRIKIKEMKRDELMKQNESIQYT